MSTLWVSAAGQSGQKDNYIQGYITSVDAARAQEFTTTTTISSKRKSDDVQIQDSRPFTNNLLTRRIANKTTNAGTRATGTNKLTASAVRHINDEIHSVEHPLQLPVQVRSTPGSTQNPLLSLSNSTYGLPNRLVSNLEDLGVKSIYPWQASCLLGNHLLDGHRNLIYTAPTGGGKSLVADVLMIKRVIQENGKKAILTLPYVALVQEKVKWLRRVTEGVEKNAVADHIHHTNFHRWQDQSRIRVAGMFGGTKTNLGWPSWDVAVCTIEKANMLINSAIEEGTIGDLAIIVLDELHMINDQQRGYIMELMVTKLLSLQVKVQIVGMSATLSNPQLLADWMKAKFYISKYCPIPIKEHLVYENSVYSLSNAKGCLRVLNRLSTSSTPNPPHPVCTIETSSHEELRNPSTNAAVALAVDTVVAGYGALVFCGSRHETQKMATLIAETIPGNAYTTVTLDQRMDVLAALQALPGGSEDLFSTTIMSGVAFYHAGLTAEEREIIAEAYDAGVLKVMVATSSLAAGINLPARRVIIVGSKVGREVVAPAMLRQMRGRAGRKGKDEIGETFLCCRKEELATVTELLEAELPPVISCLVSEKRGLKRAVLEAVATRLVGSYESICDYVQQSLFWQTEEHEMVLKALGDILAFLSSNGLIHVISDNVYAATAIGSAIVASGFDPEDGLFIHHDLRKALRSFAMDTDFHGFYLFTPIPAALANQTITFDISWPIFRDLLEGLDEASLRAMLLIGVSPAVVNHMVNSGLSDLKQSTPDEIQIARVYRRIYSTFALRDICNEVPIASIARKYNLSRGSIQSLAQTCHGFAAGMIQFCQRMAAQTSRVLSYNNYANNMAARANVIEAQLDHNAAGFSMLSAVLEQMQDRLRASARADLLEMAQVTFVKGRMARLLYENGFRGTRALAEADPRKDILPIMINLNEWKLQPMTKPRRYETKTDDYVTTETEMSYKLRRQKLEDKLFAKAQVLVASASRIWEQECLRYVLDEG